MTTELDLPPVRPNRGTVHRSRSARRRRQRILIGMAGALTLILGGFAITGYALTRQLQGKVTRISGAFDGIDEHTRPARTTNGSLNFLLVGSDTRAEAPTTGRGNTSGGGRSDALMLMHIASDRQNASIVSIPRDSWVEIPGRRRMKVNAAYALGGPSLAIRTVEQLTGVRVDHFAAIDFSGFRAIVDAVGGVDIQMGDDSQGAEGAQFRRGMNHLTGNQALLYVRERHSLPRGDLDRVRRQQNLIRAVMTKATTKDPVQNPVDTYRLIDAGTRAISVDDRLSDGDLRSLAFSLLRIKRDDVAFLTAPVRGLGHEGDQSVVYLDMTKCADLWTAMRQDAMPTYLADHAGDKLPEVPR